MQLHAQAVLDRLRSSGSPALIVYDGEVKDPADPNKVINPPYVLMYFSGRYQGAAEDPAGSDLMFRSRRFSSTMRIHCVATSAAGARALSNRVTVALLDYTPAVTGRSCTPIRHVDDYTGGPDETTGVDYHDQVDVYRLDSWPG
jgi:hypothetical protein